MTFQIEWHERLPSTNSTLKQRVQQDPETASGTVVAAREQTAGRGRGGRSWISGSKENLTASLFLRSAGPPRQVPSSAMAVAVGIAVFLRGEGIDASLKWPNDVRVGHRKICGILSERVRQGVVIGMGLNVNMERADQIDQPAVSMRMLTNRKFDLESLLPGLLGTVDPFLQRWEAGGFGAIRSDWEAMCPDLGRSVSVRDGQTVRSGVLSGFGEYGELLLRDDAGVIHAVWAGDVQSGLGSA